MHKKQPLGEAVQEKFHPKVAGSKNTGRYIAIAAGFIIVVILLRGFFVTEAPVKKSAEIQITPATNNVIPLNLDVSAGQYAASLPVLPAKPLPPPPPPPSVLSAEKMASVLDATQSEQTRLKSPTMVFGEEDKPSDAARNPAGNIGQNPNTAFIQQAANAQVVTVNAKRDGNANYKILQGKLIAAVLETGINSDMPGMVRAVVSKDIYSDTGQVLLLPRGTRLIGQYNASLTTGQTRVMVVWTRAITPQHVDIALGSPNADSLGQAGMGGDVDTHFWQIFGTSALLSVLGVASSTANPGPNSGELGVVGNPYQMAVTQGVMNTSSNVLQGRTNIQPTIRVAQGSVIQVFVARDLDFSALTRRG